MLDKKGVLEGVVPETWEVSDLRLVGEAASSPTAVLLWPAKAFLKPLGLAKEVNEVAAFERRGRCNRV
jgi:hypothetical protein